MTSVLNAVTAIENKSQQHATRQDHFTSIYSKMPTAHRLQEMLPENQRVAPSLYSLSTAVTSGQYIILGGGNATSMPAGHFQAQIPTTSANY